MKFETFITRINEEVIQQIIGKAAVKILNTLDTDLTRIGRLQSVLLNIYSPIELLSNKRVRDDFFDLLRPEEAAELLTKIHKNFGENTYETLKLQKFKNVDDWNNLLEFFEITVQEAEKVVDFNPCVEGNANYPLFKHQRLAVKELKPKLYYNSKRVLLHMPTGSGKTRTAMNVVCDHFRSTEPSLVIWLAHTEELCEQAAGEFEKAWSNIGNRNINIIRFWGNSTYDIADLKDGFIVAGLTKLYNLIKGNSAAIGRLSSNASLVIMDEAHMAIAPTFRTNLEILISFGASLLGLSATPGRTWNDPEADKELSRFFDTNKVTLKVEGYDNPVDYLVTEGYLAKVENTPLLYQSGFTISERDRQYLKDNFQLPDNFLKMLSEDQLRNILIIQKVEELIQRHKRIILFALTVKHSNLLATCLQAREISAFSITTNTEPYQRKSLIERFKSEDDQPMVLCNYGILTTGFDAPKTSCAVIARPTDSLVLYSQMVGRAIRGRRAGGNDSAEIVTVVDSSLPGFDAVASAFFNWEDVW